MRRPSSENGFTLLELAIAMAIMTIVAGAGFMLLTGAQNSSFNTSELTTMYSTVRSAGELIGQEIGQTGLPPNPAVTLNAGITGGSTTTATVTAPVNGIGGTNAIFPGMIMTVDPGPNQEMVYVYSVPSTTTFTICTAVPTTSLACTSGGKFANTHSAGASVIAQGAFYQAAGTYYYPGTATMVPTPTTLKLFGDIRGDGTLVYVEYNCNFNGQTSVPLGTTTPGKLTRSITTITPTGTTTSTPRSTAETLVDNLIFPTCTAAQTAAGNTSCDPAGTTPYCFKYLYTPMCNTSPCTDAPPYGTVTVYGQAQNMVTGVGLKISVQSARPNPKTGQYWSLSKSFLNLSPRNVLYAEDLAANAMTGFYQPTPTTGGSTSASGGTPLLPLTN